jgi:hypothetical protein
MSAEAKNYMLVKVGKSWDLSQLAEFENELLLAFPSRNVLWAGSGAPQPLADYAESEGIANVSSDFRSGDLLQPEVIYVALGWLGGAVAAQIVEQAVTATMEAVKRWWEKARDRRRRSRSTPAESPPPPATGQGTGSVTVLILGIDGKELGRGRFDLDQDGVPSEAGSLRTADGMSPSGSDERLPPPESAET